MFKVLALLLAILVVMVVVTWYHCGDEILTFLDLDATPRSPLGSHCTFTTKKGGGGVLRCPECILSSCVCAALL